MYLVPDLVEDVHVSFQFWGEKVESSVTFAGGNDDMVLFESANMMLRDSVVNVEGFGQLIDVSGFGSDEVDDLSSVCSAAGSCEDVPEESFP